jgi:hypothetical protein
LNKKTKRKPIYERIVIEKPEGPPRKSQTFLSERRKSVQTELRKDLRDYKVSYKLLEKAVPEVAIPRERSLDGVTRIFERND